jgi:WD40-like Beta Propeller Repeat
MAFEFCLWDAFWRGGASSKWAGFTDTIERLGCFEMSVRLWFVLLLGVVVCGEAAWAAGAREGAALGEAAEAIRPTPEIFAPGVVSGPANDGSPAFMPDGKTIFFTRSTSGWGVIVESHWVDGKWSRPAVAPFSGEWPDSSPDVAPDGSYVVFQSTRPKEPLTEANKPKPGEPVAGVVSNLWRVDRVGDGPDAGWSKPARLPDAVNIGDSIWKPSVAADGTIYFVSIDAKGGKRLYSARYAKGGYEQAQALPFSDGTTLDVDPEIAPDESFLVFCSAGRLAGDAKDHLFIALRDGKGWGTPTPVRYAGDEKNGYSTDDEPRLGPDHRTLYFSSDRAIATHFPRSAEQAKRDFEQMETRGWFSGYGNVWSIPITGWLTAGKGGA